MIEVTCRIRFTRECLGNAKRKKGKNVVFRMPRGPNGRVMFLPTWWKISITHAAKLSNRHQELVKKVEWDPFIEGEPTLGWQRTITEGGKGRKSWYAEHEAFEPGTSISVNAILPSGITIEEFWRLMDLVGQYRGVSPFYREGQGYGTFDVVSVQRRLRMPPRPEESSETNAESNEAIETKK